MLPRCDSDTIDMILTLFAQMMEGKEDQWIQEKVTERRVTNEN